MMIQRDMNKRLAVIIPAMNEGDTIGNVLREVKRLSPNQIIVVVNGSTDSTSSIALNMGASVIGFQDPLGNDVGRAIGALHADADIYLFLDADIPIPAEDLLPFVVDVQNGVDIALNSIDWVARHPKPDEPTVNRYFLNIIQGRRDLGVENVLTIPHAFSRKALFTIGREALAIPQLANTLAIHHKLRVAVSNEINVLAINKRRKNHKRKSGEFMSTAYQRMHGDAVEALHYLIKMSGIRAGHQETVRKRKYYSQRSEYKVIWNNINSKQSNSKVSIVLSITDRSIYVGRILKYFQKQHFDIIPIVQIGSNQINQTFQKMNIPFIYIPERVGPEVAFAIGAKLAKGDVLVFHNNDVPIDPWELEPFYKHILSGKADLTINDQSAFLKKLEGTHFAHIGSYFMNITANRNDLSASSLLFPPFGTRRSVVRETLGKYSLLNLAITQLRAIENGLKIKPVAEIDYTGRLNPSMYPLTLNESQILGDFMEALYYWTCNYGPRGGFFDGKRNRSILPNDNQLLNLAYPNHIDVLSDRNLIKFLTNNN